MQDVCQSDEVKAIFKLIEPRVEHRYEESPELLFAFEEGFDLCLPFQPFQYAVETFEQNLPILRQLGKLCVEFHEATHIHPYILVYAAYPETRPEHLLQLEGTSAWLNTVDTSFNS